MTPNSPIPLRLVDGCLYIDNSSTELLTTCRRQAYYNIVRKLELNREGSALAFGEAFHTVLEHLYRTHGTGYRDAAANADIIRYASARVLNPPIDDYRTTPYLVDAIGTYLTQYPGEGFSIARMPSGEPAIELPFAMPLGTISSSVYGPIRVIWTGKIDMVYDSQSRLGVMDHKTTSMMGPQFFAEFEFAHQMYGYVAATEYILGRQVDEICINGLGCRKPTRTGQKFEFSRHLIPVSRAHLAEWHVDCMAILSSFVADCESGYLPKMTKWCINKYGGCQYRGVCAVAPEHRESVLSTSEFRPVTWTPLRPKDAGH